MSRSRPRTTRPSAFHLLVTLRHLDALVWRRVRVPASTTLAELARILHVAFTWHGALPYRFVAGRKIYEPVDNHGLRGEGIDDATVTLGDVARKRSQMVYLYDWFGECWEHDITVEEVDVDPRDTSVLRPAVVDGANMAPTMHHLARGARFDLARVADPITGPLVH